MAESEAALVKRIVERLRKDHPDPAMRAELYEDAKLTPYVTTLVNDADASPELIARVAAAVKSTEDGTPHDDNVG